MSDDGPRVRYETPAPGVARVVLDRADKRNAQDKQLLYELNDAFDRAARDDAIKAIVLAAEGPHFSSGHDLRDASSMDDVDPVGTWAGFDLPGAEGPMATEEEIYFGLCWRWRNLPKPTIAQVQGKVIAGGLMLVWVCDLVVAAEDASFQDPVVAMGVNGVEYFAHPWELGARKAKELLFTGEPIDAHDAHRLGMVNHVVPPGALAAFTMELAEKIARQPSFALKLAKLSVNGTLDTQGQWSALRHAMAIQQLAHTHNEVRFGSRVDPSALEG